MTTYPYDGRHLTLLQIKTATGYPLPELHRRLVERGMTVEEALAEPLGRPSEADLMQRETLARGALVQLKAPPQEVRRYTYEGRTMTLSGWARATGIRRGTLECRLNLYGWPIERALTTPVRPHRRHQMEDGPVHVGRQPRLYEYRGQFLPMKQIARLAGVSLRTAYNWRSGDRVLEADTRRERNSQIITRMLKTIHPRGYCQTFPIGDGTGVGSHEIHCEGTSA